LPRDSLRGTHPVDLRAPHGHLYVVAETWTYTGRSILPGGIARGPAFDW